MSIDRRELLIGAALAAAAGPSLAATGRPDPRLLHHKLQFRSDDGILFWWLMGPKIGQVGTTLTPLFTNCVGTVQRVRHNPDGSFDLTQLETVIALDLETGEPLQEWKNPYTGEVLPIKLQLVGPATVRYRPDHTRVLPKEIGGTPLEATSITHPPMIVGDDVFIRDESVAKVSRPGASAPFVVNDIAVYHGSLANLTNPKVTVGDASVFFAEVTSWQGWMKMGDRPGNLTSRLSGRKLRRYEDLPDIFRRTMAQRSPEFAADPVAALDKPAHKFER